MLSFAEVIEIEKERLLRDLNRAYDLKGQEKLFSSNSDEWGTPKERYLLWDNEFHFNFDAAANANNALCDSWSSDSLEIPWNGSVWCNPPYSIVGKFIAKGWHEANCNINCDRVVLLVPARTDTKWFHEYIYDCEKNEFRPGVTVRFIKGRLKFVDANGEAKNSAPFPSMLVIFGAAQNL